MLKVSGHGQVLSYYRHNALSCPILGHRLCPVALPLEPQDFIAPSPPACHKIACECLQCSDFTMLRQHILQKLLETRLSRVQVRHSDKQPADHLRFPSIPIPNSLPKALLRFTFTSQQQYFPRTPPLPVHRIHRPPIRSRLRPHPFFYQLHVPLLKCFEDSLPRCRPMRDPTCYYGLVRQVWAQNADKGGEWVVFRGRARCNVVLRAADRAVWPGGVEDQEIKLGRACAGGGGWEVGQRCGGEEGGA